MTKKTILGWAGATGAAALAVLSLQAADPTPAASPAPAPSEAAAPKKPEGKGWGEHRRGGPGKFSHDGRDGKFKRCGWGKGKDGKFGKGHEGALAFGHMLNLTDDQKAKVKAVMAANKPKIEAILKEQREKIQAVMAESEKEIRPILTPEQLQVLDDAKKLRADGQKLREATEKLRKDAPAKKSGE